MYLDKNYDADEDDEGFDSLVLMVFYAVTVFIIFVILLFFTNFISLMRLYPLETIDCPKNITFDANYTLQNEIYQVN